MNKEDWLEIDGIFSQNESIKEDHKQLAEKVSLICRSLGLQSELDEISKKLQEMSK